MGNLPLIEIKNICKSYKGHQVLKNISFSMMEGQICGLVGENGVGKTTLLRIISGLITKDSGEIETPNSMRIGSIIESPALYLNLSAYDNLNYIKMRYKLDTDIQALLRLVGLGEVDSNKRVKNYSLGMKQRLAIAIAIIDSPQLLILDEPINGLDPKGIKELRDLILKLRNDLGITILISSHILSELELIVDKYIIMRKGEVAEELSRSDFEHLFQDSIYFLTTNNDKLVDWAVGEQITVRRKDNYLVFDSNELTPMALIHQTLLYGESVEEVFRRRLTFEEYYLHLINQ